MKRQALFTIFAVAILAIFLGLLIGCSQIKSALDWGYENLPELQAKLCDTEKGVIYVACAANPTEECRWAQRVCGWTSPFVVRWRDVIVEEPYQMQDVPTHVFTKEDAKRLEDMERRMSE